MSTENNNTMIPDQANVKPLRELTASVQELCNTTISGSRISHPNKSRAELKVLDAVSNTIHEEINMGRPGKIMDWEELELMSVDDIEMETKQYTQIYEGVSFSFNTTRTGDNVLTCFYIYTYT